MAQLNILQINKLYYPSIGGVERVVQQIAEGLKEQVNMSVLVCQSKGAGNNDVVNGVPVKRCGSFGTFFSMPISISFLWELRRQSKGKDILQFHAPFPLGDLACLLSGYKGKVVLYWHSDVVKQKKWMLFYKPIMNRFLKRVDVIIVAADGVMHGSSYLEPYKHKCVTIPFAVETNIDEEGKRFVSKSVPKREGNTKFLFVGRLVYYKGIDLLLRAFSKVKNAELTIVGTGDIEEQLKLYVQVQGMSEKVHFLGGVEEAELYRIFGECDVLVLPSVAKSEAFGLVQLEAMAFGKPVINTNLLSGVPEVSLDGVTGMTVEPCDEIALTAAMQWMVDHPEQRAAFGAAARKRVTETFTVEVMMSRLMKLYESIMREE